MKKEISLIPAALYGRVSSDRQDLDLSVSAQLRALRDYAEGNGYLVVREYVDDTPTGKLMEAIIESVDEFYSENLAQEVKRGMRESAFRGFWVSTWAPYQAAEESASER